MTGTVLTNNGLALITKLVAAKATLEFSRVAVGTGKVPQGVDPQAMINLNAYKMDAQISSYGVSPDQEDVAYIVTQVSSIGVSAGFAVTEGGVFANDPDKGEILFAYLDLTEDPQYVYAETDSISKFVEITFNVLIGSVEKVTAYVTPGALVKKVEFEEMEKRVEETEKPIFEDYTGDTSVPAASAAIEALKSKSKLGALLSNIKAAFKGACLIGHIVNNCVTDNPNLPLSAAQGKALMDAVNVLNTKTSKTGHIHDDRYYTEAEVDAKFNQRILVPSPTSSSGGISTYQIKPQIADQGIFCLCRSELYIVRLGQSGGAFNAYDLIQISDHTATINATVSLTTDKKALIFKCSQFENPIFIGRF